MRGTAAFCRNSVRAMWGWGSPEPASGSTLGHRGGPPSAFRPAERAVTSVSSGGPPCRAGCFVSWGVLRYLVREIFPPSKQRGLLSCMRHHLLIGRFSRNLEREEVVWKVVRRRVASARGLPGGFLGLGLTPSGGTAGWWVPRPSSMCAALTHTQAGAVASGRVQAVSHRCEAPSRGMGASVRALRPPDRHTGQSVGCGLSCLRAPGRLWGQTGRGVGPGLSASQEPVLWSGLWAWEGLFTQLTVPSLVFKVENSYSISVPIFKQFHKNIIGKGGANIKKVTAGTSPLTSPLPALPRAGLALMQGWGGEVVVSSSQASLLADSGRKQHQN